MDKFSLKLNVRLSGRSRPALRNRASVDPYGHMLPFSMNIGRQFVVGSDINSGDRGCHHPEFV